MGSVSNYSLDFLRLRLGFGAERRPDNRSIRSRKRSLPNTQP